MEKPMDPRQLPASSDDAAEKAKRERNYRSLRKRILLYLGGFEIAGIASLELAAECFRRADPDPDPEEMMRILNDLLRDRGLAIQQFETPPLIHSFPPLNRRTMISGGMEPFTLCGSAKRVIWSVFRPDARRNKT